MISLFRLLAAVLALLLFSSTIVLDGCRGNGSGADINQAPLLKSISVNPAVVTLTIGATQQFSALGIYTDGSTANLNNTVSWSSSNSSTATIAPSGLCTSMNGGSTVISASLGSISGSTTVTVPAPKTVRITPATSLLSIAKTQQLSAMAMYEDGSQSDVTALTTWSSSVSTVAAVSNSGLVTGVAPGSTTISGSFGNIIGSATVSVLPSLKSISVSPLNWSLPAGMSGQFIATAVMSDGSTQNISATATWTSSSTETATISNSVGSQGLASALAIGVTTISAELSGFSGATVLTVTAPIVTTGLWNSQLISSTGRLSFLTVNLAQTGDTITGNAQIGSNPAFSPETSIPLTGTVSSSGMVNLSGIQNLSTFNYSGSLSADQTTSTGTYYISGSSTEQGSATLFHPPSVAGSTFNGSFDGGDNGTITLSLTFAAESTISGASTQLTGSGLVNGLQLTCGVGTNFMFVGSQSGLSVTGQLLQNGTAWANLGGVLNSNDTKLAGHAVLTQGNCNDIVASGTLTNTNPNPVSPPSPSNPAPPVGPVYIGDGQNGPVTMTILNLTDGTGSVLVNDVGVSCPAAPQGAIKDPTFQGVSCGSVIVPAGSSSIRVDAIATPGDTVGEFFLPCASGGGSTYLTAWSCTIPLYNVPAAGVSTSFRVEFGIINQP